MTFKEPKIGDFVILNDGSGGIIKRIGINTLEIDNNVNVFEAKFNEVDEVFWMNETQYDELKEEDREGLMGSEDSCDRVLKQLLGDDE